MPSILAVPASLTRRDADRAEGAHGGGRTSIADERVLIMAKKARSGHHAHQDSERAMAKNTAAEARAKAAVRDVQSVAAKTRGMQQKAQAKRG
ncbi:MULTISPECIES: hypothetical protein [unclassified Streptomyces]|uniref:hypothetical protein n=1 Tax=unclassified Streptomyces TaxID=2593676 RepID=UPI00364E1236